MKKLAAILFVCLFTNNFSQTNVSPQFSELKGIEDQLGNTHLFYRIYEYFSNQYGFSQDNSIYHFIPATTIDSLFLSDYIYSSPVMEAGRFVYDYDFWGENFNEYIFCGVIGFGPEPIAFIERFDGNTNYYQWGEVNDIDISEQNDSLIYAGGEIFAPEKSVRSADGGWNWTPIVDSLKFLSLNPFNENLFFLENDIGFLYRSTDAGISFTLVDEPNQWAFSSAFNYDSDQLHIYRLVSGKILRVSSNLGEPFSWQTKYSSDSQIFISIDESISGTIYLADKRNIFLSTDYGNTFNIYKTLDRKIVGIYKKPNSNKLYAATKYRIYEVDLLNDSLKIIKSITPVSENYNWFPLEVGNLWSYENYYTENGVPYFAGYSWNWIDDKVVLQNGLEYFRMIERLTNGDRDTVYIRLDSLTAIIYAYSEETGQDLLFEDLSAELGDSVCYEYNSFWGCPYVQSEDEFNIWGLNTMKKALYPNYSGWVCDHSLVKGIGLFHQGCGDLTTYYSNLIGCVINGVVYGDTTTVGVDADETPIATEFRLEQNYPNPFNPSTKIKYQIPASLNPSKGGTLVQLIVYDILGNQIATLVNEEKQSGVYEVEFDGSNLPSGIYFYQLRTGDIVQTKKMVYLK